MFETEAMDCQKVGRARIMMRLPSHRRQLSDVNFLAIIDLLEACGMAAIKRDSRQREGAPEDGRPVHDCWNCGRYRHRHG